MRIRTKAGLVVLFFMMFLMPASAMSLSEVRNGTTLTVSGLQPGSLVQFVLNGGVPVFVVADDNGQVKFMPLYEGNLSVVAKKGGAVIESASATVLPPLTPPITISRSSSGGGGGGGGGVSGESFSNIILKENYDLMIENAITTSYRFKSAGNPVTFVNITGNVSAGLINTAVEVLKGTSTIVKEAAPGTVYKNVNIWVGTSGFATSRNIKEAIVVFRVENSWFDSNVIARSDIKLVKWDGAKWITLETSEKIRDSIYTHFEGKTTSFSPFAITSMKADVSSARLSQETPTLTTQAGTPATGKKAEPINLFLIIGVIAILVIIAAVYLKYEK